MLGSVIKMQKLTLLDIIKGLLFCAVGLAICFLFMGLFGAIFFDNILNIENPLYLVLGATGFLVVYCFDENGVNFCACLLEEVGDFFSCDFAAFWSCDYEG